MRRSAVVDDATRSMTAYHEGGHALVSLCVEGSDPIHKATIIQSNFSLDLFFSLPSFPLFSLALSLGFLPFLFFSSHFLSSHFLFSTHFLFAILCFSFRFPFSLSFSTSFPSPCAHSLLGGHALGMVSHLPEGDQLSKSKKQMMAQLAVCMAGRAAEEVVYGEQEVTSGT